MQIIIPHINTDLDALGAAVGAQVLYPQAVIVLPGSPNPLAAEFISLHRYNMKIRSVRDLDLNAITRAIVVDTADPDRLGPLGALLGQAEIHLYDHHPEEPEDIHGTLEVRDLVGAATTLLAELIEESGAAITPMQATAMLLGIYADTGSLRLMGTTDRDARAAAFLLAKGGSLRAVDRFMQGTLSPGQQALLQQLQQRSRWINVRGARIRIIEGETNEYVGGLALVVHRLQDLQEAPALFAVVRMAERVYLVGRSEVPWVDVAQVMAAFGGGGHRAAASAVVKGTLIPAVLDRLEEVLGQAVERPLMARDVMSFPVKTISPEKQVREAERLMLRHGHTGLPVMDEQGHLEGLISLRDVEKARRHGLEHAPVKGIMIRRVVTVTPDTPLDEVQELMVEKDIGRVPVVEAGNVVGIISRSDLLGLLYGGPVARWHRTLYADAAAAGTDAAAGGGAEQVRQAVERAPRAIRQLLRTAGAVAEQLGTPAYAVGGFVRDLLLGRPNLDIDIVVEGDGIAYAHVLSHELNGQVKEVPRFGTAHIYMDAESGELPSRIDVATARREFYEHAAALPVVENANLREDLYRRDFSINAMAVRLGAAGPGGLVDFFGGFQDLQDRHVRILHTLSFVEDPTRILRAVRFAHRYGFTLEPNTAQCAQTAVTDGFLDRVSIERLRNEMLLILQEPRSGGALASLDELAILGRMLPGLRMDMDTILLLNAVDRLGETMPDLGQVAEPWLTKLMLLLSRVPVDEAVAAAGRLKLRREPGQALVHALSSRASAHDLLNSPHATPADLVRTLKDWSPEGLAMLALTGGEAAVGRYWGEWRHVRLAITGLDLVEAGVPEGPLVRTLLERVLADRLDGAAPDRETQLALALRYASEEA